MHYVAAVLLLLIGLMCSLAVFHYMYKDNLVERVGLSIMGGYCFLEIEHLFLHPHPIPQETMVLYIGLVIFGIGLGVTKVVEHHQSRRG